VPEPRDARLAVLIDADNTSASHADNLLEEIAKYGTPTVKRAYGDWTDQHLVRWRDQFVKQAIQPVQQFAYTKGKNASDSALIIDAMDLLYSGNLDAFAIVSSDSDFTRLAMRLRESGATVYGLGRRKTPESFRAACDRFIFLENLGAAPEGEGGDEPPPPLPDLRTLMTKAIESTSGDDGWSTMSAVGNYLGKTDNSFDSRNYNFPKLSTLAKAQDYLQVESGSGSSLRIRLKPSEAPKKAAAKRSARKRSSNS
jgi:NYN domain/OST-HTH/LOTUS domain